MRNAFSIKIKMTNNMLRNRIIDSLDLDNYSYGMRARRPSFTSISGFLDEKSFYVIHKKNEILTQNRIIYRFHDVPLSAYRIERIY
jgi:hypothetical protein